MAKSKPPTIHQFSRKNAKEWQIPEAILLSYFSERVRKSRKVISGKNWFYNTSMEIATRFPYWDAKHVDEIIQRLRKKKLIEVGNYNRWRQDKTRWFTVSPEIMSRAAEDPVYFRVAHAQRYGIRAALVLFNLELNIERQMKDSPEDIFHALIPTHLAELLPLSASSAERAIRELRVAGAIRQREPNSSFYTLPRFVAPPPPKSAQTPSASGMAPSQPSDVPSKTDKAPSKAGNITPLEPYKSVETPLEEPFKTPQATPAASVPSLTPNEDHQTTSSGAVSFSSDDYAIIPTYTDLKERCRRINERHQEHIGKLIDWSSNGCDYFIANLTPDRIYSLGQLCDRNKILRELRTPLAALFVSAYRNQQLPISARLPLFAICLDMLITAFLRLGTHQHEDTAVHAWYSQAYQLCLKLIPVYNDEESRLERLRYEHQRADIISPDADKENLSDIAPAQKARVLRNAVQARNDSGWFIDYGNLITNLPRHVDRQLVWSYSTMAMAENFFSENPTASVAEVIEVLDECVQIKHRELSTKGSYDDPFKRSRRAVDVSHFFTQAENVLKEIGSQHGWKSLETGQS